MILEKEGYIVKKVCIFVFALLFLKIGNVSASTYYTNTNGVNFTKEQYDFISKLYYDGYQDLMSEADLNKMITLDLFDKEITSKSVNDGLVSKSGLRSTSVYYGKRTLTISSVCTSECLVSLMAKWDVCPTIQSWDVIGFRTASGLVVNNVNMASVVGTGYSATYYTSDAQISSNGFGYSVKLGNAGNLKVTTSMYTEPIGIAYGSYQHAVENVSNATSKLYTIGLGGYGYVFHFYGNAYGKYDAAPGVYKTII